MKLISESAFRSPWAAHLAWYVRGYRPEDARPIWDWVISDYMKSYWRSDVIKMLDRHKDDGDIIVLVSGGPAPMLERIAREVGADYVVGTVFEIQDGSYTGRIVPPVNIGANKPRLTRSLLRDKDIDIDYLNSFVYGDAISDVALMELVGNPVATYPDDGLRDVARERGWRIFPDMYKIDDYS